MAELVEFKKWRAFPCASTSERLKRLDMIEADPALEVRFVIPVSPGHSEILFTELQHRNPPGTDAREVDKAKRMEAARKDAVEAAKAARKDAEEARKRNEERSSGKD